MLWVAHIMFWVGVVGTLIQLAYVLLLGSVLEKAGESIPYIPYKDLPSDIKSKFWWAAWCAAWAIGQALFLYWNYSTDTLTPEIKESSFLFGMGFLSLTVYNLHRYRAFCFTDAMNKFQGKAD